MLVNVNSCNVFIIAYLTYIVSSVFDSRFADASSSSNNITAKDLPAPTLISRRVFEEGDRP